MKFKRKTSKKDFATIATGEYDLSGCYAYTSSVW